MDNQTVDAKIISIKELLSRSLAIPNYQRPYRWEKKNVLQLLEDIFDSYNKGKEQYRIGTIILHENGKKLDIVDGQQRITTLLLILHANGNNNDYINKLRFNHYDSFENIKKNYPIIKEWLKHNSNNDFIDYILESCDVVEITVKNLSEAFQLFDTQNGRGKELLAYNLLKAYHIRAMDVESQDIKIECDKRWESAAMYDATPQIDGDPNIDILKQLFDEQLFRGRIWSKGKIAKEFSKSNIDEFKGFTIDKNHPISYPYQNLHLLQYLTSKYYKNILEGVVATQSRFEWGDSENISPFVSLNQPVVNGKDFFEYIETYVEIYKRLFLQLNSSQQLSEFKKFYYKRCLNYGKELSSEDETPHFSKNYARRSGDSYLREAYKTVIFILFDKFGEKGLNRYYEVLYKLIYINRLSHLQLKYETVANIPKEYISIIVNSKEISDLEEFYQLWIANDKILEELKKKYRQQLDDEKNKKYFASGMQSIIEFILD